MTVPLASATSLTALLVFDSLSASAASIAVSAMLTVYTDESMAYGSAGDTFAYAMTAPVPEPISIVATGARLAGLAFMRRRRTSHCLDHSAA